MVGRRWFIAAIAAACLAQRTAAVGFNPATDSNPGILRSTSGSPPQGRSSQGNEPSPRTIPNAYIIELNPRASLDSLESLHTRFHRRAEEENVEYQVRHEFTDPSFFYGLSIELGNNFDSETLKTLPDVRAVWPVLEVARPTPAGFEDLDIAGPVAPKYGFNTSVIRGENYKIDYNLKMAGVEHLHSHGFKGKGVKIAIIDSGIDYRHPALGGGFGPGKKVAFGRNYVSDDQGGPDDPIATCSSGGHGTHVAGIIGGDDPKDQGFGLLGVAPEATLGMYRVFSCYDGAASDVVMQAMIDAVKDGADIISMSLGLNLDGWERDDPFAQIVTSTKSQGVAVIVAAGNNGRLGPFLTNSPAIARDAVAVASADSARFPTTYKVTSNRGGEWRYSSLWPIEGEFNVYAPEDYEESLVCAWDVLERAGAIVQERGWDIASTFFMVRQSTLCSVETNAANINYFGFKGVLSWRDQEFENPYDNNYVGSAPPLWIISVDGVDGPKLHDTISADPLGFRLRFSDRRFLPVDNPSAGFTSNYSTMGNTWEFNVFKPLLSAPGHLILSTWPLEDGGYSIISGTSMATPFVAGCYALLKSAYPDLTVDEMTNLFSTTAQPAKYWGNDDVLNAVTHQGAGMINVWNAYNSGAKFESGCLVVGESAEPVSQNITFTNTLGRSKTFEITHVPAGLMQRTPYNDIEPVGWYIFGFPSWPIYATVGFETPTTITLAPGETTVVSFIVTPPAGVDPDTIPVYSGFIRFVSGRDIYNVPYMGLPYVINEVPVLERDVVTDYQLPALLQLQGDDYDYVEDLAIYDSSNDEYPTMVYFARQPSEAYRLDLVAANTTFTPTFYGFNRSNVLETTTPDLPVVDTFGGAESFGILLSDGHLPPVYHYLGWFSELEGQGPVLGDYRWLLRVLPLHRDYDEDENWVSWLSPILRLTNGSI